MKKFELQELYVNSAGDIVNKVKFVPLKQIDGANAVTNTTVYNSFGNIIDAFVSGGQSLGSFAVMKYTPTAGTVSIIAAVERDKE